MKKTFTLSALSLLAIGAFAQLPVSTTPSNKNAILEEFTGIHCVYCPDGHRIAAQITSANPNRAFAVNIHTGGYANPAAGEPDLRTADGTAIAAIPGMGITGYPQGAVSRHLFGSATAFAMSRSIWSSSVNTIMNQSAYVNVAGAATLDANTRDLTVNVEAYYTANSPQPTNKLTVMLLQNNINGPQTGASTYNPTMVNPDGTYRHMHALRDVITTSATGDDISPTTAGTLISRTINYNIPLAYTSSPTYLNVPVDLAELELLVFVAEGTSEIINVARIPITITGLTTTNNASAVTVIAEDNICSSTISPVFTLKNMGNATLTSATVSYSINGGSPATYNWFGNLNPLASTDVTLPAISFNLNATNMVDVTVTSVNGGTDDDLSDNSASANFNYTSSVSPTLDLTLNVVQDRYGSETTWKIFNSAGVQVAAGGPYSDLAANGTLLHTHTVTLPAWGCYRFVVYDAYGDGMNGGYGAGSVTILDGNSNSIYFFNGVFASQSSRNFDAVSNPTGIQEHSAISGVTVYPNPVAEKINLDYELVQAGPVTVRIVDAIGKVQSVLELGRVDAGSHTVTADVSGLSNGIYMVEMESGSFVAKRKITISH